MQVNRPRYLAYVGAYTAVIGIYATLFSIGGAVMWVVLGVMVGTEARDAAWGLNQ